MKRILIAAMMGGILSVVASAGVLGVVKHLAVDGYHGVKYQVVGLYHGVKHAAGDLKTVAK